MKKKFAACILIGLLTVNSLCIVPVGATVSDEQSDSSEEVESYRDKNNELEAPVAVEEDRRKESLDTIENHMGITIDAEHFPDADFRSYVGGEAFDKNQDGVFSVDEISQITSISGWVDEYAVEPDFPDMRGVEYFTNLSHLAIAIAEPGGALDFSKMPHLETLTKKIDITYEVNENYDDRERSKGIDDILELKHMKYLLPKENAVGAEVTAVLYNEKLQKTGDMQ